MESTQPTVQKKQNSRRRVKGEGTIIQRDGRFVGVISLGYDAKGKRIRRWVYGKTQREVQDEMTRLKNRQLDGMLCATSKLTVAAYLERWLEDSAKQKIRPTTYESYKQIIETHIAPRIGGVKLSKLTAVQIEFMYGEMARQKKSPRLRQMSHAVLHRALSRAVKQGILAINVCTMVERPRVAKREMKCLTPDQAAAFLTAAEADRLHTLYILAITTGMRQGELFGLKWDDVDLDAGVLSVRRTITDLNGEFIVGAPKSAKGTRQINLPAMAVEALADHRKRMMIEGNAGAEYLLCDRDGGPLRRQNVLRRSYRPILKRAGCPTIRFHDLRHTSATMLLADGVHPKVVQERLGHSQISVTLDTYSHVLEGMDKSAAGTFDKMLPKAVAVG